MISLYDGQITDLLGPNYRRDEEVQCLSHAIREGMRVLLNYKDRALVYADIDHMKEDALDLLATELRAQYYDTSYTIEVKRDLVKQAVRWFQVAGTKAAVEELAKSIFGECEVNEWFEYSGSRFTSGSSRTPRPARTTWPALVFFWRRLRTFGRILKAFQYCGAFGQWEITV